MTYNEKFRWFDELPDDEMRMLFNKVIGKKSIMPEELKEMYDDMIKNPIQLQVMHVRDIIKQKD